MATVTIDSDILVHVYSINRPRTIGHQSDFVNEPHPGTNKKIEGWIWDQRYWPTTKEFDAAAYAPSLWDPTTSGIAEDLFQSGYGDNKDILLLDVENTLISGLDIWAPKVNHGYFYVFDEEWYLYSDSFLTEYFTTTGIESGQQVLTLSHDYKPTIPIQVRRWSFDRVTGRHRVNKDFRKVLEFSDDPDGPEFIVDTSFKPPKLILDGDYTEVVGSSVTLVSGVADPATISGLELIGISEGTPDQEFQMLFSPLAPDSAVEVWTWVNPSLPMQWSGIDPLDDFQPGPSQEVKIDYDRGTIQFGNYDTQTATGNGKIPSLGHKIGIYYTKGLAAMYEPNHSRDYILAYNSAANVSPVASSTPTGFVYIATESLEPATITLTSTLPRINPFLINLGNNIGELIATVRSASGAPLEGQEVTFNILAPQVGTFGASSVVTTAITDANGEARTFYNSPPTISELGRATTAVSHSGGNTVIDVDGLVDPGSPSGLFIYKVHEYDEALGINENDVSQYYTDYLDEIEATAGVQGTEAFEQEFRTSNNLLKPVEYQTTDIITGKKTILLTKKPGVVNPHSGIYDVNTWSPLYPASIEDVSTDDIQKLRLTYSGLLDLPGTNDTKSYFAIGDAETSIQASVGNQRTNRQIRSNIIGMRVRVPPTVNGTYFCDVLSEVENGLLTNAKNVDLLSDAAINSTSGIEELYKSYLDERLFSRDLNPKHRISFTAREELGGSTGDLRFSLYDGASLIETYLREDIPSTTIDEYFYLTESGINSISDYSNLKIGVEFITPASGIAPSLKDLHMDIGANIFEGIPGQTLLPISTQSNTNWIAHNANLVQGKLASNASGDDTIVLTLDEIPTDGNLLVLGVAQGDNVAPVSIIQSGVTWTLGDSVSRSSPDLYCAMYYAENVSNAGSTITITLGSTDRATAIVSEFSGVVTSFALVDSNSETTLEATSQIGLATPASGKSQLLVAMFGRNFASFNFNNPAKDIVDKAVSPTGTGNHISTCMAYDTTTSVNFVEAIQLGSGFTNYNVECILAFDIVDSITLHTAIDDDGLSQYDHIFPDIGTTSGLALFNMTAGVDPRRFSEYETYLDWFRRTRRGDTIGLSEMEAMLSNPALSGLDIVTLLDCPSEIPLGFRLKSTGITVASVLDQITFLDPNDYLPSGYFIV